MENDPISIRSDVLDSSREADQISAVDFAIETVKLWAEYKDDIHPIANGPSNLQIVHSILRDQPALDKAHTAGYWGHCTYRSSDTAKLYEAVNRRFGRPILALALANSRNRNRSAGRARINTVQAVIESFGAAEDQTEMTDEQQELYDFATLIMGTHAVFRYLDTRISRGFKQALSGGEDFKVAPGFEEKYWRSRIIGDHDHPGIFQTKGMIARLMSEIGSAAEQLYGDQADDYLAIWWPIINIAKPYQDKNYLQTMEPVLHALLSRNLASADLLLKEYAHNEPEIFPYRSRARIRLDDEEKAFFDELIEEAQAPKATPQAVPVIELTHEERVDHLRKVEEYLGSLVVVKNDYNERTIILRGIAVGGHAASRFARVRPDEQLSLPVPYVLQASYCVPDEMGELVVRSSIGTREGQLVETFYKLIQAGRVSVIHKDERYLDKGYTSVFAEE